MKVIRIDKSIAKKFVETKHYSRKLGIYWCAFGLVEDNSITGVAVFGQPSPPIQKHAFRDRDFRLYELSRVVVQSKTKNAASFLVGNSLKLLQPRPCAVVSYADSSYNHAGIIYQATNWIYTGCVAGHDKIYLIDGKPVHPMTLKEQGITGGVGWAKENNIEMIKQSEKHRYFYLCGSKSEKRKMLSQLTYSVVKSYPKCDKKLYDDGESVEISVLGE